MLGLMNHADWLLVFFSHLTMDLGLALDLWTVLEWKSAFVIGIGTLLLAVNLLFLTASIFLYL